MATIIYPALAIIVAIVVLALILKDAKALGLEIAKPMLFWGIGICLYLLARTPLRLP